MKLADQNKPTFAEYPRCLCTALSKVHRSQLQQTGV